MIRSPDSLVPLLVLDHLTLVAAQLLYATFSTSTALRPPKANELESAYSTC